MHNQRRVILLDKSGHFSKEELTEMGIPAQSQLSAMPFMIFGGLLPKPLQMERVTRNFTCPDSGDDFQAWFELVLVEGSPIYVVEVVGIAPEDEDLSTPKPMDFGEIDNRPVIFRGHVINS